MTVGTRTKDAPQLSLAQTVRALLRHYLTNRKVLGVIAVAVVGAGIALNWSWLAAAGIAPILLALAPCAAMCALGRCMKGSDGKSCSAGKTGGVPDSKDKEPQ